MDFKKLLNKIFPDIEINEIVDMNVKVPDTAKLYMEKSFLKAQMNNDLPEYTLDEINGYVFLKGLEAIGMEVTVRKIAFDTFGTLYKEESNEEN